jgi:hypothetical protein
VIDTAEPLPPIPAAPRSLADGTKVEVRQRYDGRFSKGFEVAGQDADGYRIRRLSDGSVLPVSFARGEIRRERHSTWWR